MTKSNFDRIGRKIVKDFYANLWPISGLWKRIRYSKATVKELINNTDIFFVISTGRSGTQMLSSLLNRIDNLLVLHEPNFHPDINVMEKSKNSHSYAYKYINNYRIYSIYEEIVKRKASCYGEVTGTLRYHVKALRDIIPRVKMALLVRDGRDVIRSAWRFDFYKNDGKGAYNLIPKTDDQYYKHWDTMSRFEKFCWSWSHSIEYALKYIPVEKSFQFEKIISDYEYFQDKVLTYLDLSMDKKTWLEAVTQKSPNKTKQYAFPHWKNWPDSQKNLFNQICGATMAKIGYKLNH